MRFKIDIFSLTLAPLATQLLMWYRGGRVRVSRSRAWRQDRGAHLVRSALLSSGVQLFVVARLTGSTCVRRRVAKLLEPLECGASPRLLL